MRVRQGLVSVALALVLAGVLAAPAAAKKPHITFYAGLERPEDEARAAFFDVTDPDSPRYREFLATGELADAYGASDRTRRGLRKAAKRRGIKVAIDPSGVMARLRAPRPRMEEALGMRVKKTLSDEPISQVFQIAPKPKPELPDWLAKHTREFVGAFIRSAKAGAASRGGVRAPRQTPPEPGNAGTWIDGCDQAKATGSYSPEQVRDAYGIDALGGGAGAHLAIMNVAEGVTAEDIADNAACFGYGEVATKTLRTDGQKKPFGHDEPAEPQLDLALARGMSPQLERLTFTQTWGAEALWFLGPAQVLAEDQRPDALSISYGTCEKVIRGGQAEYQTRAGADLMDTFFARLGLLGVGTFVAAGDQGSTCAGLPFPGVLWPASSPFATAVGGTRLVLDAENERVDEVVWNDSEWLTEDDGRGAGGGGSSSVSRRPRYQDGLGVPGNRRAVPDVSAHASLLPGWPVVFAGNWLEFGGTSAASPLTASAFATISASERAAGRPPLGNVNGWLYAARAAEDGRVFDVVSGNNGLLTKVRPIDAEPGYDRASGVGVPLYDRLAAAVPPPGG